MTHSQLNKNKNVILRVENLSFSYSGTMDIIRNFSLDVNSTERLCICAPSGTGKSTLLKLFAGYLKPSAGLITINDVALPTSGVCPVQLIWQDPHSAFDPFMYLNKSLSQAGLVDDKLLQSFGVEKDWLTRYPHELSAGQLQRIAICRALLSRPKFLLADEISSMLDARCEVQIWKAMCAHLSAEGIGLIFVSHSGNLIKQVATRKIELK